MRILLDECVNPRVRAAFKGHQVSTVIEMGWGGVTNGKLLALAQEEFDVFVTLDQNIEHQLNLRKVGLGLLVVKVPDNKVKFYKPIFSEMREAAERLSLGQVLRVKSPLI
jgi:predicted nuclease of predicted toxin-antitoxin system